MVNVLDPFTQAIRATLVEVRGGPARNKFGTGFFVAERRVLTCLHVVDHADTAEVLFGSHKVTASVRKLKLPEVADVVLLVLGRDAPPAPGCARLGYFGSLHDAVRARGFPVREAAPHEEQVTGTIEDLEYQHPQEPWKSGARLIKFKDGQVAEGLSGSPLVHEETRRVIGVVTSTRTGSFALGGVAVPSSLVFEDPEIRAAQRDIEWEGTLWAEVRGAEGSFLEKYLHPQMPFFGRGAILRELDDWLRGGPARGILCVRSGMGKSLTLARWFAHLRRRDDAFGRRIRIAIVPVLLMEHSRREDVLLSLERAVKALRGQSLRSGGKVFNPVNVIRDGLSWPAAPGEQLLLIIDGMDETMGWDFGNSLFPRELGSGVRVLVSARDMANVGVQRWRERLGWESPVAVREFSLGPLGIADLREAVATRWLVQDAEVEDSAQRLLALTAGDPLLVGWYLAESVGHSLPAPPDSGEVGSSLHRLFHTWWEQQQLQWRAAGGPASEQATSRTFSVLSGGFAPMSRQTLLLALRQLGSISGDELDAALGALARLVLGSSKDGYVVNHPELARWRWTRLEEDQESTPIDAAFVTLGRKMLTGSVSPSLKEDVESYLLRAMPLHMQRLGEVPLDDVTLLTGAGWRERQLRSGRWPTDYTASLDIADAICRSREENDVGAALGIQAEIAVRRASVGRLNRRVSGRMAATLVSNGLWTARQALDHVLATYKTDFPRIAALGAIAAVMSPRECRTAMEHLALERDYGFDWDESLGAWNVAAAATLHTTIDYEQIRHWGAALPGIGAAAALLGHAASHSDDTRVALLADGLNAFPAPGSATYRTYLGLAKRVTAEFSLRDVERALQRAVGPYVLADLFGFDVEDPKYRAIAMRMAWPWLSPEEIESRRVSLVTAAGEVDRVDADWGDWYLALGAVWDVCSVGHAEEVFSLLESALKRMSDLAVSRTLYMTAIRFASRLPGQPLQYSQSSLMQAAFGRGIFLPEVRDLFRAAGSLLQWRAPLAELVPKLEPSNQVEVLDAIADVLPMELLEPRWAAAGRLPGDVRDATLEPILTAIASRSSEDARRCWRLADQPDSGPEYQLLMFFLDALKGSVGPQRRAAGRSALEALPYDYVLRGRILSVMAPVLAPWSVAECEAWAGRDGSFNMSFLLPHIEAAELADLHTPERLAIRPHIADEYSVTKAIRRVFQETSLEGALAWAEQMAEASEDQDRLWIAFAVQALAGVAGSDLVDVAMSVAEEHTRALCCASVLSARLGQAECDKLWNHVESRLVELIRLPAGAAIAAVLRRLNGVYLQRALRLVDLGGVRLQPATFSMDWLWVECAIALMPWVPAEVIDKEFIRDGEIVRVESGTDRARLRAALAPRVLELGDADLAVRLAYDGAGVASGSSHVAMVRNLGDARTARSFAKVVVESGQGDASVFAVSREMRRLGASLPRPVAFGLCDGFLAQVTTEAHLFLMLTALAPMLLELGGRGALERVEAALK